MSSELNSTPNMPVGHLAYDAAEQRARTMLSNRVIEAFQPEIFNATGYPVRISDDAELWRYVDVMHETRLKATVEELLGGLTPEEFELFRRAATLMVNFSMSAFGKKLHCENALLRALGIFRYIRAFKPKVVLELGPGSGYLGLLHILSGIGYIGCDNTQAFYLLQSKVWAMAGGSQFTDLASSDKKLSEILNTDLRGRVLHVPWWKAVELDLASLPSGIELVTANHCLAEMHGNALKYYVRMAHRVLENSGGPFLFEGWGYELMRPRGFITKEFQTAGFRLCHTEDRVNAFVPASATLTDFCRLPRRPETKYKLRNCVRRLVGLERLPYEYQIHEYGSDNPASRTIREARREAAASSVIGLADILDFLDGLYGERKGSDEERFLALIGQTY